MTLGEPRAFFGIPLLWLGWGVGENCLSVRPCTHGSRPMVVGLLFSPKQKQKKVVVLLRTRKKLMRCTSPNENCWPPASFLETLFGLESCFGIDHLSVRKVSLFKKKKKFQSVPDDLTGVHRGLGAWVYFIRGGESWIAFSAFSYLSESLFSWLDFVRDDENLR